MRTTLGRYLSIGVFVASGALVWLSICDVVFVPVGPDGYALIDTPPVSLAYLAVVGLSIWTLHLQGYQIKWLLVHGHDLLTKVFVVGCVLGVNLFFNGTVPELPMGTHVLVLVVALVGTLASAYGIRTSLSPRLGVSG